jgi:hypothetical protein
MTANIVLYVTLWIDVGLDVNGCQSIPIGTHTKARRQSHKDDARFGWLPSWRRLTSMCIMPRFPQHDCHWPNKVISTSGSDADRRLDPLAGQRQIA